MRWARGNRAALTIAKKGDDPFRCPPHDAASSPVPRSAREVRSRRPSRRTPWPVAARRPDRSRPALRRRRAWARGVSAADCLRLQDSAAKGRASPTVRSRELLERSGRDRPAAMTNRRPAAGASQAKFAAGRASRAGSQGSSESPCPGRSTGRPSRSRAGGNSSWQ